MLPERPAGLASRSGLFRISANRAAPDSLEIVFPLPRFFRPTCGFSIRRPGKPDPGHTTFTRLSSGFKEPDRIQAALRQHPNELRSCFRRAPSSTGRIRSNENSRESGRISGCIPGRCFFRTIRTGLILFFVIPSIRCCRCRRRRFPVRASYLRPLRTGPLFPTFPAFPVLRSYPDKPYGS